MIGGADASDAGVCGCADGSEGCVRPPNACPSSGIRSERDLAGNLEALDAFIDRGANELGPGVGGGLRSASREVIVFVEMSRREKKIGSWFCRHQEQGKYRCCEPRRPGGC